MRAVRRHELAERASAGTQERLLWRPGTRQLCVEVTESGHRMFMVPVQPEQALDAFHHPYAYAGAQRLQPPIRERREP
jgi:hypothetical protein